MTLPGNLRWTPIRPMTMRPLILTLILAACTYPGVGPAPVDTPSLTGITEEYPCGYGFQAGTADQTTAVFAYQVESQPFQAGSFETEIDLPGGGWEVLVVQGSDLFANWCDDVMEPGEPVPHRDAEHRVIDGHLSITAGDEIADCAGVAVSGAFTGLVIEFNGERLELGDVIIVNEGWGCFAG